MEEYPHLNTGKSRIDADRFLRERVCESHVQRRVHMMFTFLLRTKRCGTTLGRPDGGRFDDPT